VGHLTEAASNLVDALGSQQDEIEQREAWINERLKAHPEMARRIRNLQDRLKAAIWALNSQQMQW
jgi:hypothetical protein